MRVIVCYSRYGIDLDVKENSTKKEFINAYLRAYGGPQGAFNHFINHAVFIKDSIKDANIIDNDDNRIDSEEASS